MKPANTASVGSDTVSVCEWCVLGVVVATSVACVLWVLRSCHYGIDFSDEGFYLNWISQPWLFDFSVSQFGFIYHPLYRLVAGDLAMLRQGNMLITLGVSWLLWMTALTRVGFGDSGVPDGRKPYVTGIALVFATSSLLSLLVASTWLPTPSYNSLALQGVMITATGVVMAENRFSRASVLGWVLVGAGGWLTFMAKPTTAAALAIAVGTCFVLMGRLKPKLLTVSLAVTGTLTCASAWAIAGSMRGFVLRVLGGVDDVARLGGGHTLAGGLRWDSVSFGQQQRDIFLAIAAVSCLCTYFSLSDRRAFRHASAVFALVAASVGGTICAGWYSPPLRLTDSLGLLVCAIPVGGVAATILVLAQRGLRGRAVGLAAAGGLIAALPYVYAFGSNNNYWVAASGAAVLWLLAGIFVVGLASRSRGFWPGLLATGAAAQSVVIVLLHAGMENPYRQPLHLHAYDQKISISRSQSDLVVSRTAADYIRRLRTLAFEGGFREGTPMIDLTGRFPTALYVVGAQPVGLAWMLGGYPGSERLARSALDRVACKDIGRAWILSEPSGPRRLSGDVLGYYGADVDRDFSPVGSLESPIGEYPSAFRQVLLKPTRPAEVAQRACDDRGKGRASGGSHDSMEQDF